MPGQCQSQTVETAACPVGWLLSWFLKETSRLYSSNRWIPCQHMAKRPKQMEARPKFNQVLYSCCSFGIFRCLGKWRRVTWLLRSPHSPRWQKDSLATEISRLTLLKSFRLTLKVQSHFVILIYLDLTCPRNLVLNPSSCIGSLSWT